MYMLYMIYVYDIGVVYVVYDTLHSIFIAQLVEHCTGIAEVTGSNPAEA